MILCSAHTIRILFSPSTVVRSVFPSLFWSKNFSIWRYTRTDKKLLKMTACGATNDASQLFGNKSVADFFQQISCCLRGLLHYKADVPASHFLAHFFQTQDAVGVRYRDDWAISDATTPLPPKPIADGGRFLSCTVTSEKDWAYIAAVVAEEYGSISVGNLRDLLLLDSSSMDAVLQLCCAAPTAPSSGSSSNRSAAHVLSPRDLLLRVLLTEVPVYVAPPPPTPPPKKEEIKKPMFLRPAGRPVPAAVNSDPSSILTSPPPAEKQTDVPSMGTKTTAEKQHEWAETDSAEKFLSFHRIEKYASILVYSHGFCTFGALWSLVHEVSDEELREEIGQEEYNNVKPIVGHLRSLLPRDLKRPRPEST